MKTRLYRVLVVPWVVWALIGLATARAVIWVVGKFDGEADEALAGALGWWLPRDEW